VRFQLSFWEVSASEENFLVWAVDPRRTSEELFTIERMIERSRPDSPFRDRAQRFDEMMETLKARKFNPGYRPALPRDEVEYLYLQREKVIHFGSVGGTSDRLLRDIQALRFFPGLEQVSLESSDVSDLSPLAGLLKIKEMAVQEYGDIGGHHPLDFSQCGEMPELERLRLALRHAWPDFRALARWPSLRELYYSGNVIALAEVEALPALQFAQIHKWVGNETPLRDLRHFPAMPQIARLKLENTSSLDGIERYSTLLNLELGGDFRDLTPLTKLPNLTYLKLTGEFFTDLAPLTQMSKLREIVFVRERPLDLSILAEAPQLRRVEFERCDIMRTELGALNAALIPEENDFLAETPRPLAPLKFYSISKENKAGAEWLKRTDEEVNKARQEFFGADLALVQAEYRSATMTLQRGFDQLLGRGWGLLSTFYGGVSGHMHIAFRRYQDTVRIREMVGFLRQFSAAQRFRWGFFVNVEPHGDMSYELKQLKELDEKAKEPEGHWLKKYYQPDAVLEENVETARMYEEKYELLAREHLHQLHQQQGGEIDPLLTQPPPEPPAAGDDDEPDPAVEEELLSENTADDEDGNVAIAPPPPAPPGTENLGEDLSYYLQIRESCVIVNRNIERASYALGLEPIEFSGEPAV
jgi:hypothetical protein